MIFQSLSVFVNLPYMQEHFPFMAFFLEYSKNPRARIYLEYFENGNMPLRKGLLQPTISKEHQVPQILKASPLNRNKREKLWKQ